MRKDINEISKEDRLRVYELMLDVITLKTVPLTHGLCKVMVNLNLPSYSIYDYPELVEQMQKVQYDWTDKVTDEQDQFWFPKGEWTERTQLVKNAINKLKSE